MTRIIGLTGYRQSGKSTVSAHLRERHGFHALHAFAGGKVACEAWFQHIGADADIAARMVHGDLRDTPSPLLPCRRDDDGVHAHATPRFFMEMFGNFMGDMMGPEWTAGTEFQRLARLGVTTDIVADSVVYEEEVIRSHGGIIIRIDRAGTAGKGMKSDAAVDRIEPDAVFVNDHDTVEAMLHAFDARFIECASAPSPSP